MTERWPQKEPTQAAEAGRDRESWQGRVEVPLAREYYDFQFSIAKEIAQKTGLPVMEAIASYAPAIRGEALLLSEDGTRWETPDGVTEENIVDTALHNRLMEVSANPIPYHAGQRYGCSYYTVDDKRPIVYIHFFNAEFDTAGPLSKAKLPQRMNEIADVMQEIRTLHPQAEQVHGESWLYNLEAYRRLYPEGYTAHLQESDDPKIWGRGTTIWGQFIDSDSNLKQDLADSFLSRVKKLPSDIAVSEVPKLLLEALPLKPLRAQGDIADFYKLYGIK